MKAVRYNASVPRYVLEKTLGRVTSSLFWSDLFAEEFRLNGSFLYNRATGYRGEERSSFSIEIDQFASHNLDLSWLVIHPYDFSNYKQALGQVSKREDNHIVKAVFQIDNTG